MNRWVAVAAVLGLLAGFWAGFAWHSSPAPLPAADVATTPTPCAAAQYYDMHTVRGAGYWIRAADGTWACVLDEPPQP